MASELTIANRALQKVGASRIGSLTETSKNARAIKNCIEEVIGLELERNAWVFAIKRVLLSAEATAPVFGRAYSFVLPSDYKKLLPVDPKVQAYPEDWLIENGRILTDEPGPLYLRYVGRDVPAQGFSDLFAEACAARVAIEIVEELTQSNTKKASLESSYTYHVNMARSTNAIEHGPVQSDIDAWEYKRL